MLSAAHWFLAYVIAGGHRAARQDDFAFRVEPRLDPHEHRHAPLLAQRRQRRFIECAFLGLAFDGVQFADQREHLRRALGVAVLRIVELARACAQQATSVTPCRHR